MNPIFKFFLIQGTFIVVITVLVTLTLHHAILRNKSRKFRPIANINATDIEYIDQPEVLRTNACRLDDCNVTDEILWTMVFIVKSRAPNFKHRELIRRTWGAVRYIDGGRLFTMFCVGQSYDEKTNNLLREEKDRYHDLLHYAGPDDYTNIAFKTLTGMRWASDNLPDDYFYSTADDDFFVDLGILSDTIANCTERLSVSYNDTFPIICTFDWREGAKPFRHKTSKWYISEEEYPYAVYPKFCLGGMYTATVAMIRQLWSASQYSRPMRVDDVWITGILRENLGISKKLMVKPQAEAAFHYFAYSSAKADNVRGFMRKEWEKIFANFRNKSICFCRS